MPKTIPCWDCRGKGTFPPCSHTGCYSHMTHPCEGCGRYQGKCKTCKGGGVLSVYTQEEVNDLVKAENEACMNTCLNILFEDWSELDIQKKCAEAIRARNK